jgi:hypothetical protein
MLIVETIGRIRREHFIKGKTIKEIARDLKVSRNTVRRGNCLSCIRKGFGREERRGQNVCGGAHVMTGLRSARIDADDGTFRTYNQLVPKIVAALERITALQEGFAGEPR